MLTSKFSFPRFYLTLAVFTTLFLLPAMLLFWPEKINTHHDAANAGPMKGMGIIMLIICLWAYYLLLKTNRLTINPDGLMVRSLWRKKTVSWYDIEKIDLMDSGSALGQSVEATTIYTKTGQKFVLPVPLYSNMREMRLVLGRAAVLLQQGKDVSSRLDFTIPEAKDDEDMMAEESADIFSDSFIFSFNGSVILVMLAAIIILLITGTKHNAPAILAMTFFLLLFCFAFGTQAYYFLVSDSHLIVKNHLFRWYRKVYALEDIKDAKLERPTKRSTTLRITTKDFQSNAFSAGTLRTKTWQALLERFSQKRISVRNEVFA
jgi:hypothetical protein